MVERVTDWVRRYPILSIEDPVSQDDLAGMALATANFGDKVQLIGDDILVTNAERVRRAAAAGAGNAVLVKVNQAGTGHPREGGAGRGQVPRLGRDRLGALRRDGGRQHRALGGRLGRGPTQGRQLRALRTHGEME
jgi:hypothetical protein